MLENPYWKDSPLPIGALDLSTIYRIVAKVQIQHIQL